MAEILLYNVATPSFLDNKRLFFIKFHKLRLFIFKVILLLYIIYYKE